MITFAYITNRVEPYIDWYLDSLYIQLKECEFTDYEVLIVDSMVNNRALCHGHRIISPKLCAWSGDYKITSRDYFSAANARNSAIIAARGSHIVFSDDVSVLANGFVKRHIEAYEKQIVMAGIQHKARNLIVEKGDIVSIGKSNTDSREDMIKLLSLSRGLIEAPDPAWTYGNNLSLPIRIAEKINGFDEIYDGQYGVEDCDLGIRINNSGEKVYINSECLLIESEEAHHRISYKRAEKIINGRHANESVCWEAKANKRFWTLGNRFNLEDERKFYLENGRFQIHDLPIIDWRDGEPLCKM